MNPAENNQSLAFYDNAPFLDKALKYAVQNKLIDTDKIEEIINDAATGTVQISEYFGASSHLRENLEQASVRMASLVSLHLENASNGELELAAQMIKEKTFRTLSRGGSQMLKALYSLPEEDILDMLPRYSERDFLKACLDSNITVAKYRQTFKRLEPLKLKHDFADWMLKKIGVPNNRKNFSVSNLAVDNIIRTCLLYFGYRTNKIGGGRLGFPNENNLLEILTSIRVEWSLMGDVDASTKILEDMPDTFVLHAKKVLASIKIKDIPKITNQSISIEKVFSEIKNEKYSYLKDIAEMTSIHDKKMAVEWFSLTSGTDDDRLLLSLFICAAAGLVPKTSLKVAEAKKVVLNIRENGLLEKNVTKLIQIAPHEEQEQLRSLWTDFIEEASIYLLDESDEHLTEAVAYLKDHCNIITPQKK